MFGANRFARRFGVFFGGRAGIFGAALLAMLWSSGAPSGFAAGNWLVVGPGTPGIDQAASNAGATVTNTYDFSIQSVAGFDCLIFYDASFYYFVQDAATSTKVSNFVQAGGGLYVECGGTYFSGVIDYSWGPIPGVTSQPPDTPLSENLTISFPGHPLTLGLTNTTLDDWYDSAHGDFINYGGMDVILTNQDTGKAVMLAGYYGAGNVVYANMDPTDHADYTPAALVVLQNGIAWASSGHQTSEGTIRFEKDTINCSDTIKITVSDADLQGAGTIAVSINAPSTGDTEPVILTEIGVNTGVLEGAITTALGAPAIDGVLQILAGGNVVATYNDADDGTGSPATVTATAATDCAGPAITNVQIINVGTDGFTVTFDTSEPATGLVTAGLGCGGAQASASTIEGVSHAAILTGLESCTPYFVRIQAADAAGNIAIDDNGGACYPVVTGQIGNIFFEDFEPSIMAGWTRTGLWHVVTPGSGYLTYVSAVHSFWYGAEATGTYNYPAGGSHSGLMRSPAIAMPASGVAALTFFSYEETEELAGYDTRQVWVEEQGMPSVKIYEGGDDTNGWAQVGPINMTAWSGKTIRLVFQFTTGDGTFNDFRGWIIDDIRVATASTCVTSKGLLNVDKDLATCSDSFVLTLLDSDLAGDTTATVTLATTPAGDVETISLNQVPGASGVFTGVVATDPGAPQPDGAIQVVTGGSVIATYSDADAGGGTPGTAAVAIPIVCIDCQTGVATVPFYESFDTTPSMGPCWEITGTYQHRTEVRTDLAPNSAPNHLVMDDATRDALQSRNEATLTLNLSGYTGVKVSFWAKAIGDEAAHGPPSSPFTGGADFDGLAASSDYGVTWHEILDLRNLSQSYTLQTVDLDAAVGATGLWYNNHFKLRWNHYDNDPTPTDGIAIDDIKILGIAPPLGAPQWELYE